MRRKMASPSKMRLGSFSSRVSSTRAALRNLLSANCTRQSSRLLRRPNSPTVFSSLSRRSFSNGRRGFLKVLESVGWRRRGGRGQSCVGKKRDATINPKNAAADLRPDARAGRGATVAAERSTGAGTYSYGSTWQTASFRSLRAPARLERESGRVRPAPLCRSMKRKKILVSIYRFLRLSQVFNLFNLSINTLPVSNYGKCVVPTWCPRTNTGRLGRARHCALGRTTLSHGARARRLVEKVDELGEWHGGQRWAGARAGVRSAPRLQHSVRA